MSAVVISLTAAAYTICIMIYDQHDGSQLTIQCWSSHRYGHRHRRDVYSTCDRPRYVRPSIYCVSIGVCASLQVPAAFHWGAWGSSSIGVSAAPRWMCVPDVVWAWQQAQKQMRYVRITIHFVCFWLPSSGAGFEIFRRPFPVSRCPSWLSLSPLSFPFYRRSASTLSFFLRFATVIGSTPLFGVSSLALALSFY
ncbi:hypothetical protein DFH06DRAFT_1348955 [Mycena polygramma]|nr:hypothetical protein DFH06DRAFT_1348955 [Mycena polygramma]